MSLTPSKPDSKERQLPPAGTHRAVLYKIINLGTLDTEWKGEAKKSHKIRLFWELSDEQIEYEVNGEKKSGPFSIGRKFTFSMGDNSHLYPIVTGITGGLTDDERWNFDIESLLGQTCLVTVVHDEYEGRKYAKVTAATSLPKSMETPEQVNESQMIDVRKLTQDEIDDLPEYIRDDMKSSQEYHVRFDAPRSENPTGDGPESYPQPEGEINPDDIPF